MDINRLYDIYIACGGRVTTDSRKISGGELFFALRGETFDGNEFALKALEAGAAYAVVSSDSAAASMSGAPGTSAGLKNRIIPVPDTLETLQALARWHRSVTMVGGKPLTVIALTGTNGKTTTKELIRTVLSTKYRVTATEGNLNNSIGVPLTLLTINPDTEIAVVEMGASHPGDIKELVSVALPNYGLITNVGRAHLLGFGSFEGVMQAKGELYDYLQRTADRAFVNVDNKWLADMASQRPDLGLLRYGVQYEGAQVLPVSAQHPFLRIRLCSGAVIQTNLVGAYNADNVMAALAVGREFGVAEADAVRAISRYVPSNNRSQMVRTASNLIIVDAYNANPTSMAAALDSFQTVESAHKAVMLGNMLELGEDSLREHIAVIERVLTLRSLDRAIFVGGEFRKAFDVMGRQGDKTTKDADASLDIKWFETSSDAAEYLKANPLKDSCVLVKGSRGSAMEKVIPML